MLKCFFVLWTLTSRIVQLMHQLHHLGQLLLLLLLPITVLIPPPRIFLSLHPLWHRITSLSHAPHPRPLRVRSDWRTLGLKGPWRRAGLSMPQGRWPHPHQLQRRWWGRGCERELTWPVDGSWAHFLLTRGENRKDENKLYTGQVYISVHMRYLASLLHKSHLFLTLFSAGEMLFFRGLQGLQSYRRSSSDRLSIIQLMQDTHTEQEETNILKCLHTNQNVKNMWNDHGLCSFADS